MNLPAGIEQKEDRVLVKLAGEIDHHSAQKMREDIDACVRRARPACLSLDFSGVEFMDSSGIGLVLGRYRLMQEVGGTLELCNMPPSIRKVMRVAGIETLDIKQTPGGSEK